MLLGDATAQTDESLPEFNPNGKILLPASTTILGSSTTYGTPQDVAFDREGRIYVVDRNNQRVVVLDRDYNYNYTIGTSGGDGDLTRPTGAALNSTHIFVLDRQPTPRILIFLLNGSHHSNLAAPPGVTFNQLKGIAVTPEGRTYVAYGSATDVIYYHPNGTHAGTLTLPSQYDSPDGMDVGPGGLLAIVSSGPSGNAQNGHFIGIFNISKGHEELFKVGPVDTKGGAEGQFSRPIDAAFSGDGRFLAVADSANERVQVFLLNTTDDGVPTGLASDRPVLIFGGFGTVVGVGFDSDNRLAAISTANRLVVYDEFVLPAVKSVTAAPDPATPGSAINANVLSAGRSVLVDVSFNTNLARVNTTAGIPYLALGPERNATLVPYDYSETTRTLQFTYTVQENDAEADFDHYPDTALMLNGSDIAAGPKNVTALTALPWTGPAGGSLLAVHGITFDMEPPVLEAIYSPNASDTYTNGSRIVVALNYSEPVWAVGPDGPSLALNVAAGDGGVASASYLSGNGTAMLSFSYEVRPGDSAPDGLRHNGTGALTAGSVVDAAGNAANRILPAPGDFAGPAIMLDTAPPRVLAVDSTLPAGTYGIGRTIDIAVTFDEDVTVTGIPMLALATTPPRSASYVQGTGSAAELTFRYMVQLGDSTSDGLRHAGTDALSVSPGSIADAASNAANLTLPPPSAFAGPGILVDAVPPRVLSVDSASSDGTYGIDQSINITVTFDKAVTVTGNPMLALATTPPRSASYVQGTGSAAELMFMYVVQQGDSAPGGLRHAGAGALGDAGSIVDAAGNAANRTLPDQGSPGPLAGILINTTRTDGGPVDPNGGGPVDPNGGGPGNQTDNAPTVAIGPGGVPAGQGDLADRGPGVNVTIDVSGLPGAGIAGGTVQFPQRGATVTTSFASVSFQPNTTATSVPADGMLVLRVVAAGDLPSNSSIQRSLAYDGSGAVVLQKVVEVGDEDVRIVFDKPVRISLEGQAKGRAFYIAGAGGQITPIDAACAADDTARVERHLNGTGECRIESDGDMVIYTYHLTRFGTVKPANDAMPPPVYHTCSVALEKPDLRIDDARLKGYSTPVSQRLFNTGSAEFERVGIEATRWQPNLGAGSSAGAGAPSLPSPVSMTGNGTASSALVARVDVSLPASLTEVREEIEGGAYAAVGGGTAVAAGLGGGDDRQLWFKLNLTQYSAVQGETITQSVTYNAQCTEP